MRQLVLVRHAKTEKDADSGRDEDRQLDARGHTDSALIAAWLKENRINPDLSLVSTATRTRQTWDILASMLPKSDVSFRKDLYLASASDIFKTIRKTPPAVKTLLVLGHNPGLHEIAWTLTGKANVADSNVLAVNFPTGAIALLSFPVSDWTQLTLQGGTLSHLVTPKLLKNEALD